MSEGQSSTTDLARDSIATATQEDTALPDNSQVSIASDVGPAVADPAYSTDLGMWDGRIADNVREYWVTKDSSQCQHKHYDFSATATTHAGEKSGDCKGQSYDNASNMSGSCKHLLSSTIQQQNMYLAQPIHLALLARTQSIVADVQLASLIFFRNCTHTSRRLLIAGW